MIQFEPFSSAVDATFWHALNQKKINDFKLDDSQKPIKAYYSTGTPAPAPPSRLCLGISAFDRDNDA